jgi:hypothetical protein
VKVSKGNPKTKQVELSIKLATLTVTKATLLRIALKLKLSFIRLLIMMSHVKPNNDTSTIKMISSPCDSSRSIWAPKLLLTNHEGPNKACVSKLA